MTRRSAKPPASDEPSSSQTKEVDGDEDEEISREERQRVLLELVRRRKTGKKASFVQSIQSTAHTTCIRRFASTPAEPASAPPSQAARATEPTPSQMVAAQPNKRKKLRLRADDESLETSAVEAPVDDAEGVRSIPNLASLNAFFSQLSQPKLQPASQ